MTAAPAVRQEGLAPRARAAGGQTLRRDVRPAAGGLPTLAVCVFLFVSFQSSLPGFLFRGSDELSPGPPALFT